MARVRGLFATPLPMLGLVAVLMATAGGSVAAVRLTDRPAFCVTCHEMKPYNAAWAEGPHRDVSCISCHVDPSAVQQIAHKAVALKEVWVHLAGSPEFPKGGADVPNTRCLACHGSIREKPGSRFSHATHIKETRCATCHPDTGHKVSLDALRTEGVLASGLTTTALPLHATGSVEATSGAHKPIDCSSCHDLDKVACVLCHAAPHRPRGDCQDCHSPKESWKFTHATSGSCTSCHTPPKDHFPGACSTCHKPAVAFKDTKYTHDGTSSDCARCHQPPSGHFPGTCSTCHAPSVAFKDTKFQHSSTDCAACHRPPAGHNRTIGCSNCHKRMGTSWAFSHPTSSDCARCHGAPGGHFGSACSTCHTPSVAFKNTKYVHRSKSCADCHTPPGGHYRAACSSCHTPSVAFKNTKFTHPDSSACSGCHTPKHKPRGTCATCHKNPGKSWAFSHPS
jgi:cytochrome c nitrite reductase small subunit